MFIVLFSVRNLKW